MTNFKALGIEKEMQQCFDDIVKSDLEKLMQSCYFERPYITNRKKDAEYCTIQVTSCVNDFWYKNLIGFDFFVE